MEDIAFQM